MKKIIMSWLSTPYYFNPSLVFKLKTSFKIGLFIFIFLYIFQPFNLASLENYLFQYTALIGICSFLGSFIVLFVPPLLFKSFFNEDKWTIGKNILYIFIALFFIGSVIWFFSNIYKEGRDIKRISLPLYLLYTFLVGAIPIFFMVYLNERNLTVRRRKRVKEIKQHKKRKELQKEKKLNTTVTIYSDNNKESICFNIDKLIYVTSQGNYASFYLQKEDNTLKEEILRVTLAKIDKELEAYTKVIRCHKSYIINTNFVTDISGNARGYLLKSDILDFDIPVSRSFSKQSLMSFLE